MVARSKLDNLIIITIADIPKAIEVYRELYIDDRRFERESSLAR